MPHAETRALPGLFFSLFSFFLVFLLTCHGFSRMVCCLVELIGFYLVFFSFPIESVDGFRRCWRRFAKGEADRWPCWFCCIVLTGRVIYSTAGQAPSSGRATGAGRRSSAAARRLLPGPRRWRPARDPHPAAVDLWPAAVIAQSFCRFFLARLISARTGGSFIFFLCFFFTWSSMAVNSIRASLLSG